MHLTIAVCANCEPKLEFGPSWLKKASLNALAPASLSGSDFWISASQPGGRARDLYRRIGSKAESHKKGRIVYIDRDTMDSGVEWLLQWQCEMQSEQGLVVIDRVIGRPLERQWLIVVAKMHESEIVKLLERLDIHLGEGLELLLRVNVVTVGVEALNRHGSVEFVEGPGVPDADNLEVGPEHDFGADRCPDMRMGSGGRCEKAGKRPAQMEKLTKTAQSFVPQIGSDAPLEEKCGRSKLVN